MSTVQAATPDTDLTIAAQALGAELRGSVILPDHPAYDEARVVWNTMHEKRPAVIVRAAGTADVVRAVGFGREHGLPIAVRGGGHSVAGKGTVDDGLVIDLGAMKGIRVDSGARTVWVQPGNTLGDMDRETEAYGLAVPTGVISATGVSGLTLGGGVGWLTRPYGLAADNLIGAEVVLADGSIVYASADSDPELHWGIRGGGGNFGIVTGMELRAYPLGPTVFAGAFLYEQPRWAEALRAFAAWTPGLPDELTAIVTFLTPPASWEMADRPYLFLGFSWSSPDFDAGERVVAPLRAAAAPDIESLEPTRWVTWQSAADELFDTGGQRAYWKNVALDHLDEAAIVAIVEQVSNLPSSNTGFDIHHMGGAFGRVDADATAFPNRSAAYWTNAYAVWTDPADDAKGRAWARGVHAALRPFAAEGEYVNFLGGDGPDADVAAAAITAYGRDKVRRLVALKRRVDPDNVFRLNHNIPVDLEV